MRVTAQVKTNAKVDSIEFVDGIYIIRTKARAVDGKANAAVTKLMAEQFGVPKAQVNIVLGATSRHKVIEIVQ